MLKKIIFIGLTVLILLSFTETVSAEFWACFTKGDFIDLCNPNIPDRTCGGTLCKFCMSNFNEAQGCYNQGNFRTCNGLPSTQQGCTEVGGGSVVDSQSPELTITSPSPLNDAIFTTNSVPLIYEINEKADVYIRDADEFNARFRRICSGCTGAISQSRRFSEGLNHVEFKAVDVAGNEAFTSLSFFVDSKDPRISKTEPKSGFSDGNFYVEFTELNPVELILTYGNSFKGQHLGLNGCNDLGRGKIGCNYFVDLTEFDGKEIKYWYNLTDIAGGLATSRPVTITVDITDPIINNLEYNVNGRFVIFTVDVTEIYLDEILYIDHSNPKPRWRRLCSRLIEGVCEKRVSFKDGFHNIEILVLDEAGNFDSWLAGFYTDGKDPRITKTEPRRGFTDGSFYVEFLEVNPVGLLLNYGNDGVGYADSTIDINSCNERRGKYSCNHFVDLSTYNGQEIEYWLTLEDILENMAESRHITLEVDTVYPVIQNLVAEINGNYVTFSMTIIEDNFEVVNYIDNSDPRGRFRRLCSRLKEGVCEKRVSFRDGDHDVSIQAIDEAGNTAGQSVAFLIE